VRWRGALLALIGAAAVAGIAIGFHAGGGDDNAASVAPSARPPAATGRGTTTERDGTTEVAGTIETATVTTRVTTLATEIRTTLRSGQRARWGHRLLVGTVDDSLKQADPKLAAGAAQISRSAAFDVVLLSSMWTRGRTAPSEAERTALANAVAAAKEHDLRVFIFVWHGLSGATPRTGAARAQFARYAAALVREFPAVEGVVVGNEPNLNTFWMPQFGRGGSDAAANAYFDLLARTYDALKGQSKRVLVIGGALAPRGSDRPQLKRHTHSPTQFIKDLGAAYRARGRTKPIMDAFAIHPYMRTSALPPTESHQESTTITIADYPKLVSLLGQAFQGTAQRGKGLPIYYTEFGVQTTVPQQHRAAYTQLGSSAGRDAVAPATQARYYREALLLAACQSTVRGLFVFHTFDERDLRGWQSGLYYADLQPKASLHGFRTAAALARTARLAHCAGGNVLQTG
jgi:hypothetical protein